MSEDLPFRVVHKAEAFNDTQYSFCLLLFEKDGEHYTCRWNGERQRSFSPDLLRQLFRDAVQVPSAYYRTPLTESFDATVVPPDTENMYLKVVEPLFYNASGDAESALTCPTPADSQLQELRVCEVLRAHPHESICRYLGYLPTGDGCYIAGLCFERHQQTLSDAVRDGAKFDPAFLDPLDDAVRHLHSLGFAHNDINPNNIMVSADGRPIIIDFDSSLELGKPLENKGASPDWQYPGSTSAEQNDLWALAHLREWLAGNVPAS
ncbi:kinase-like domain-containing protein [Mycena filopes]|nr:kinase-like domain-containing protein [Mycena filopes]